MKKIATSIIAVALLLSVTATGVFAAQGTGAGRGFVDADGDGVCDNYGTGAGRGFVDADGDGVCDNYGTGAGRQSGRWGGRGGINS